MMIHLINVKVKIAQKIIVNCARDFTILHSIIHKKQVTLFSTASFYAQLLFQYAGSREY
jgi:hypothetical protein